MTAMRYERWSGRVAEGEEILSRNEGWIYGGYGVGDTITLYRVEPLMNNDPTKDKTYLLGLLPLILTILAFVLSCIARSTPIPTNPRLYVHISSAFSDPAKRKWQLDLAQELGFGGIRVEWGSAELLNADNSFGGSWSQRSVVDAWLADLKTRGMGIHVTFGARRPTATLEQEAVLWRYIMDQSVRQLGPSKSSWSVMNEPASILTKADDAYLRARLDSCIQIWDSLGVREKGAWLHSFTFAGWDTWDWSRPVLATEEAHRRLSRIEWAYNPSGLYRPYLRRVGLASSFYAPVSDHDAAWFTSEVGGAIVRYVRRDLNNHPMFWTEANVRFEQWASSRYRGLKQGQVCKSLLALDGNSKVAAYVLSGHSGMEFATDSGKRDEARIAGWLEGIK